MKKKICVAVCFFVLLIACKNKNEGSDNSSSYINKLYKQVQQSPDSVGLRMILINSLDSSERYNEALKEMDFLIRKDSLNYAFWYTKGSIEQKAKDTVAAITSFTKAIKVYASPDAMLSLANLFAETKNEKALLLCAEVNKMKLDRKYAADASFIAGVYFARIGKTNEALTLFDDCINNSYTYMVAYLEKGFIYYDQKKYSEALKIFELAATVSNTYADAYYWQAKCFEGLGNKKEAINNYQKALTLDKNLKEADDALKKLKQ